jgi:hypothetical protein
MSRQLRPSEHCLNCGRPVATRFCAECGQENTNYRVHLGRLLGDLVEEVFQLESRLWRSLWTLLRHPGRLTVEYNAGRRVRYTTPLRLYLLCSVVYFFVGSLRPSHDPKISFDFGKKEQAELETELATKRGWERKFTERYAVVASDPLAAGKRATAAIDVWAPRILAILVPVFALLTMLFFRRPKHFYVEHLVFALHVHATAFLLLTVREIAHFRPVGAVVLVVLTVATALAARRVFAQSWWRLLWKLPLISLWYSILLGIGIGIASLAGAFAI